MIKKYKLHYKLLLLLFAFPIWTNAQDDCASAVAVTDLTGATCASSAPSTTSALAAGSCEEGTEDTWFSFTAQGGTANIDVSNSSNGWRPEFLVISSSTNACGGALTEESCNDQNGNYSTISGTVTGLTVGDTYWIVVSSGNGSTNGTLDVCVDNPAAPAGCIDNNDCSTPAGFPLNAAGAGASCITDCNTGASAGPDFTGTNCFDLPNPTVWYTFTTGATTTLLDINLTSADMSDPEFTLFTTADCSNFNIIDCVEGTGGAASSTGIVVASSTTYILAISDATGDEGDFDLCVTQNETPAGTCLGDECLTAAPFSLNTTGTQLCVTNCNTAGSAGPDFTGNNCHDLPNATTWYQFTTTALTATLDVSLTSAALGDPEFTIFTTPDCSSFTIINCTEGSGGSATNTAIPVNANTSYFIAISDVNAAEGDFDLCMTFNEDLSACNVDNTLEVTATSMGSPLTGPFLPSEVVTFCYTINSYITSTTNCNYLQGIVPSFGSCWDPVSFDGQGQPVSVTTNLATQGILDYDNPAPSCEGDPAGTWGWYPDGAVTYNLNSTNPLGYVAGDNVGAGWFFTTAYASPEGFCNTPETDPNSSYGDNDFVRCNDQGGWTICFQLQANSAGACAGATDCAVTMKTFADGEIGVWSNIGCTADIPVSLPGSLTCILLSQALLAFDGQALENRNKLSWEVDPNIEIKEFRVEKSINGFDWELLETVSFDQNKSTYELIDQKDLHKVDYYRLALVGLDGKYEFSNVIALANGQEENLSLVSSIAPNPSHSNFYFKYTGQDLETPMSVSVLNTLGQEILREQRDLTEYNEVITINSSELSSGIYFVQIKQGDLSTIQRIRVQK